MATAASGRIYRVQSNGKAQPGLGVGDQVVTAGGTYIIDAVNQDGSYKSSLYNSGLTTANWAGAPTTPTGSMYRVQSNGKAQPGLGVGDQVVTGGGTYIIDAVNPDGSYKSSMYNSGLTTGNWTGANSSIVANVGSNLSGLPGSNGLGYSSPYGEDIAQLKSRMLQRPDYSYAPYESAYADRIAQYTDRLADRAAFDKSDYGYDDMLASYKKAYLREGQRATANAIGQAASLTGGIASTAGINAATQAGDYYASQLADKLPELEEQAYNRYMNEYNMDANTLSMLQGLDDSAYGRYSNDRNFDYQRWMDSYNIDLSNIQVLQNLDNAAYNRFITDLNTAAQIEGAEFEKNYNLASLAAQYGDYSYLQAMGIDTSALLAAEAESAYSGGSGGGGSSGVSSGGRGGSGSYDQNTAEIQKQLVASGYSVDIDGIWGPQTEAAYNDFMSKQGGYQPTEGTQVPEIRYSAVSESMFERMKARGVTPYADFDSYGEYRRSLDAASGLDVSQGAGSVYGKYAKKAK